MKAAHPRWPIQVFRLASLVVPPALAWDQAFSASEPTALTDAVTRALAPLWILTAAAIAARAVDALRRRDRAVTLLDRMDVLTASGSALAWLSAAAIVGSVHVGYASLAVLGLLGTATLHLLVLRTYLLGGADDLLRAAEVERRFVPEAPIEGEPVLEEITVRDARIPAGFRLFAAGRVGPRWALSRHVIGEDAGGGEVVLESEIGPARRGEHEAEPLELWFQDTLGLCRTARHRAGAARITALPRPRAVLGARPLVGRAGVEQEARPARRLPTEGSLRLREYQPGDDARRIHWARSLTAQQIVVRLPDEVPPDRPAVRLVLDTHLPGAEELTCAATEELLDAMVAVWLGTARALAEGGARVTLVTAAAEVERPLLQRWSPQALRAALRLGAAAHWQGSVEACDLLGAGAAVVVSYRAQPARAGSSGPEPRWIVVPEPAWTGSDALAKPASAGDLPYPMGSSDNRWSRRRRERLRVELARRHHGTLTNLTDADRSVGSFLARPDGDRVRLEEVR